MSLRVVRQILEAAEDLPVGGSAIAVLLMLGNRANDDGGEVRPSIGRLARETKRSPRTVQAALGELERAGLIVCEHDGGHGAHDTKRWRIRLEVLGKGAISAPSQAKDATAAPLRVQKTTNKGAMVAPEPVLNQPHIQSMCGDAPGQGVPEIRKPEHTAPPLRVGKEQTAASPPPNAEPAAGSPLRAAAERVPVRRAKPEARKYSPEFESAWTAYPGRTGGNSKAGAWRAWQTRIREGVTPADLIAGVEGYARYVRSERKEHTSFVKMAQSFFGPDEHWLEWRDYRAAAPQAGGYDLDAYLSRGRGLFS
jgi:hypothetical protein